MCSIRVWNMSPALLVSPTGKMGTQQARRSPFVFRHLSELSGVCSSSCIRECPRRGKAMASLPEALEQEGSTISGRKLLQLLIRFPAHHHQSQSQIKRSSKKHLNNMVSSITLQPILQVALSVFASSESDKKEYP